MATTETPGSINEYLPRLIAQTIAKRPHDTVTFEEWNSILNLLINQGDYNSESLQVTITALIALQNSLNAAVTALNDKISALVLGTFPNGSITNSMLAGASATAGPSVLPLSGADSKLSAAFIPDLDEGSY